MAGAFMPLQRAIWLEIRSESLKENARSWTVAHLSRPDLRISADSPRIGRSGTPGGTIRTSGRGTDCESPRIARDPRDTSGNSRARLASVVVAQQSGEQNRRSLQFSTI